MGSYSKKQDEALIAIKDGKSIDRFRSTTIEALERRGAIKVNGAKAELTDVGKSHLKNSIGENIADFRPTRVEMLWQNDWRETFDIGKADYEFWDRARRGKARGLEIAGLFLKPLASKKAAWVMGQMPTLKSENEWLQEKINEWLTSRYADVLLAYEESANLGDFYIVVNGDETISLVAPHVVREIVDDEDWSRQVGWKIVQVYGHPEMIASKMTIVDEFTEQGRTRTLSKGGATTKRTKYRKVLDMVPVVHIPNNLSANEKFGHPEGEALIKALHDYGAMLDAATDGNIRQGRPTPAFEKMGSAENVSRFLQTFGTERSRTLDDGSTETYYSIDFSADDAVIVGETGTFEYKSGGSFANDTLSLLSVVFWLVVQHSEFPEFIFGTAIQSSKASADSQLPPFIKWVEKEQGRAEKWLLYLINVMVNYYAMTQPGYVKPTDKVTIQWKALSEQEGSLTQSAVEMALRYELIDDETALSLLPLDIENPAEVIKKARKQAEERRPQNFDNAEFPPAPADIAQDDNADPSNPDNATSVPKNDPSMESMNEAHTGVMIGFEVPLNVATHLARETRLAGLEALPAEDMHVTLAYLGQMDQIANMRPTLEAVLWNVAESFTPVIGNVGGVGRFNASETSDGMDVIYASYDAPKLAEFRTQLVKELERFVPISKAHGFTAHITLAYVNKGQPANVLLETIPLDFSAIVLYWGDERIRYPMRLEKLVEA